MKRIILKCRPGARFHLGKSVSDVSLQLSDTSEYIHSDTLFSALINALAKALPDKVNQLVEAFESDKVKISSAFYCLEPKGKGLDWVYFLPIPVVFPNLAGSNYKAAKKIKFISEKLVHFGLPVGQCLDHPDVVIVNNAFMCLKSELDFLDDKEKAILKIYKKISEPKVKARTETKMDALFERTDIHLENHPHLIHRVHCHFWFGLEIKDSDIETLFQTALNLLVDEGIGGERSVGCGMIEGYEDNVGWEFPQSGDTGLFLNLSLVIPSSEHEFRQFHGYHILKRGGRRLPKSNAGQKDRYLQQVQMVKEGAVLMSVISGKKENLFKGEDNTPKYRYGKCFSYPVPKNFL
ncbi:MAG: type III-A CRISPR-associated RAMP protein Csm4 [Cyclobacteriaceae bacterium]